MEKTTKEKSEATIKKNPKSAENYFKLGVLIYDDKTNPDYWSDGEDMLKKAIELDPGKGKYHFQLGVVYKEHKVYFMAIPCFERSVHLKYKVKEAGKEIEICKESENKVNNKRLAEYLKMTEENPSDMNAYAFILSHFTHTDINEEKAKGYFEKAKAIDPNHEIVLHYESVFYARSGQLDLAAEALTKIYENDPDLEYEYCGEMSYLYEKYGDYENALIWRLKKIKIEGEPDCYYDYVDLGCLYNNLGRYEEAKATFMKRIELLPDEDDDEICFSNLVTYLMMEGNEESANFYLEGGLKKYPENSYLHYQKGLRLTLSGDIAEAINSYKTCLIFDPECLQAYNNLGSIAHTYHQEEQALEYMLKALELDSNIIMTHENLVKIYFELGNIERVNYHNKIVKELKG